jgi:hypothetical protein
MNFLDEMSSDMDLATSDRIYRCDDCRRLYQVIQDQVERIFLQGYFRCVSCTDMRRERERTRK